MIMLSIGKTKVAKEEVYGAKKIKIWDVNVDNTVISKLVETKNDSKYLIGCFDEGIKPLVLVFPKMSGYVKKFKDQGRDQNKNNKLMSLCIEDDKLFGLTLKVYKILNWMFYQFIMLVIKNLKWEHMAIKFILIFTV